MQGGKVVFIELPKFLKNPTNEIKLHLFEICVEHDNTGSSDCGGITYEPRSGWYTLRKGEVLYNSPSRETSWTLDLSTKFIADKILMPFK